MGRSVYIARDAVKLARDALELARQIPAELTLREVLAAYASDTDASDNDGGDADPPADVPVRLVRDGAPPADVPVHLVPEPPHSPESAGDAVDSPLSDVGFPDHLELDEVDDVKVRVHKAVTHVVACMENENVIYLVYLCQLSSVWSSPVQSSPGQHSKRPSASASQVFSW